VKLVLKRNRYYVESASKEILERLLQEAVIKEAMIPQATDALFLTTSIKKDAPNTIAIVGEIEEGDVERTLEEEDATDEVQVHSFEVQATKVEELKRACNLIDFPMMEEYDFHNDNTIPNLDIDLRPTTVIRNYQEKSLSKMFGNGRARSGIIVLPCGAGKTLVGITAACTIKKPTLVLCTSAVSCNQWKRELLRWSNISEKQIGLFTSQDKERHQVSSTSLPLHCKLTMRLVSQRASVYCNFNLHNVSQYRETVARIEADDGISFLDRMGIPHDGRGPCGPCTNVQTSFDDYISPRKAWTNSHTC